MDYLLGIDAGTGSIRAVVFDIEGRQISIAQREWTHRSEEGVPNSMSFDFTHNWELVKECIKEAISHPKVEAKNILALSATSMREGIVLYDRDGNELFGVANVDARASSEVKYLKENFSGIEEEFYKTSGQTFALGALPRILWLKNNRPLVYDKVATISMIGDWVLYKLSGVISSDPSNAGTTGIFDLKKRSWDASMAEKIGIKRDIFPPCLEVGEVIGSVSKEASKECGLSTSTKVVTGGGDVQLGSAGLGVLKVGEAAILGGSFWQQIVNIDKNTPPPENMNIRVNPHVVSSQSQAEGITFFSGLVMRWFRDAFCQKEVDLASKSGKDAYAILEERAKDVPIGSYGITPIFSDSMKYGKWYHASPSFLNLSLDTTKCNKYSMFRSLQENAAIVSNINLEKIQEFSGVKIGSLVFAGGASKGELWSQIVADVTGLNLKVPKVKEATALGAAMSAGVGAGVYKNLEEAASKLVEWDREFFPDPKATKAYQEIEAKWIEIYNEQLKLVDRELLESMWRAPGV